MRLNRDIVYLYYYNKDVGPALACAWPCIDVHKYDYLHMEDLPSWRYERHCFCKWCIQSRLVIPDKV